MSLSLGLGAGGAAPALNAYWGQTGGRFLRDICDSGVNYATVSFINNSPEHGDGYPGSNFGANCAGEVYSNKDGKKTKLLSACSFIQRDIPYCQSKGVKVLVAIGGAHIPGTSDYDVSSEEKGVEFAEFLYNAFGPYKSSWTGPRPFDKSATEHVSVDGFDLDLEDRTPKFSNKPYIAMVNWWRQQSHKMFITAAPECVMFGNQNDELIANAEFDALFIQFYNNPVCDAIPNNTPGDNFSYDDWAAKVAKGKSKDAKLFIGLPASTDSAGSGYIDPEAMKDLVCKYSTHKNFGGVSLWDATRAMNNEDAEGKSFLQSAAEAVQYVCGEPPKTTSSAPTSTKITSTTSSTTVKTTSASSASSSVKLTTSSIKSENGTTSSIPSGKPTSSSATPEKPHTTSVIATASATKSAITSSVRVTSSIHWSNSTATRTIQTTSKPVAITTSKPVSMTTSTVYTTSVHTVTECPPTVTDCPVGHVTTEIIALYTTVCPVTETAQPPKPTTTKAAVMTTSTVYTTKTYTITECPPTVINCPVGHVTTKVIPLYTTICPVSETAQPPKPTTTKVPVMTTSTVYTTKTYTITKCPPTVTDCPVGHITTEVIPAYTTVCPVKETETGNVPKPTGPAPLSAATETTVVSKTVKVQQPSSLATSTRSAAVVPQPSGKGCSGPSCPGATNAPGSGCTGPECPGVAIPTNSWTNKHSSGCTGPQCSGVAIPTNAWTSSPVGPSAVPSSPVTAGASTLALGLTGLVAIVAAQVLAL
ncbi:chitinase 18-18 [Metarhizium guizhouense ARSEF 977]|uniref:Chitinase 18-18 n=1 Tax=Metarhizium guizhouense (strain ARSEF 977) TaxID=1276136 RepID=A0A0B4HJ64_METGA|nr:chitinase 18-18 [Metarhizium guizhouense ARSEF 977]